jgi:hypothetical protein
MSRRFSTRHRILMSVLVIAAAGCGHRVELEAVPIGTPVEVTRLDGGVVRGTLAARDDRNVRLVAGQSAREIPRAEITSVQLVDGADGATPPVLPATARFREFTIPEGTVLAGRLDSALASDTSQPNDAVAVTLVDAVVIEGMDVLPAGSIVRGVVTSAEPSGKVSGRASLAVRFKSVSVAGTDETYPLSAGLSGTSASSKGSDAKKIGIPAAGGAVLGAILGGKKGAGIGAIIGGGAGTAVVLATAGQEVRLARGTAISLTLEDTIDVRVPIKR